MAGRERRSTAELARIVTEAVRRCCRLRPGLWFNVVHVEASRPRPTRLRVWAVLHFAEAGSPFCCAEPCCQLGVIDHPGPRNDQIGDEVRRQLGVKQSVELQFDVQVQVHGCVRFENEERRGEHPDPWLDQFR